MYLNPGSLPEFGEKLTRDAAQRLARNWTTLLLNGLLLIVAGVLILSIDWSRSSLSTFLGFVFILEGLTMMLTSGLDSRVRRSNVVTGVLSIAVGIFVIALPTPGLIALGVVLGSWLIVVGTITIAGAFAVRRIIPDWWLLLLEGLLAIPLGVLALADPGATLAAIVTVGGIWAVAVGVTRVIWAFQLKNLPNEIDKAWAAQPTANGASSQQPGTSTPSAAAVS